MARGSRPKTNTEATEGTEAAVPTEATKEAPVTDTAEATEQAAPATEAPAEAPAEAKKDEVDLTAFTTAVEAAIAEKDGTTGALPVAQIEAVKAQYQSLDGLKAKNAAKKDLQDRLRTAIAKADVSTAAAVMKLVDDACVAGGKSTSTSEKTPADPAEAYIARLVALNLAYSLAANDVPEGVDADEARGKAQEQVNGLAEQADALFTWTKADPETRGDEPDTNPLAKRAVRLVQGKVSGGRSTSTGGGSTKENRGNTARHIQLFFKDQPVGAKAKIAEIAKFVSEEYPTGDASPGALNSRMKSNNPVPGVTASTLDGKFAVEKVEHEVWNGQL